MTFTLKITNQLSNNERHYCIFLLIQIYFKNSVGKTSALFEINEEMDFGLAFFCTVCSWHKYSVWPNTTEWGVLNLVSLLSSSSPNPFGFLLLLANRVVTFSMGERINTLEILRLR